MDSKPSKHVTDLQLQNLIDGTAGHDETNALENHLNACDACQSKLMGFVDPDRQWDSVAPMLRELNVEPSSESSLSQFDATVDIFIDDKLAGREGLSSAVSAQSLSADEASPARQQPLTSPQNDLLLNHQPLLAPPSHPELLGRIGDFDVEKEIGRGGCGIVYKGFDSELNRPVAIKVLSPQLASNGIARKRFAREAQAVAAVRHPNVVEIHRVSQDATLPYIVMALVPGESLEARVRKDGPFELLDSIRIASQIASGLSAAHRQGLIHRDIKPANILIEHDNNRVLITDFGLARAVDDAGMTQTGWLAGTPHYMSPEQAAGDSIDCRSDLFSLGSVIYYLATGREPFRAEKPFAVLQKIVHKQPTPIQDENSSVTATLAQIVERLFEKDPSDRFQSATEVQSTLENYLAHLQNPNSHPAPVIRPKSASQKRGLKKSQLSIALASFAVVALIATAVTVLFWNLSDGAIENTLTRNESDLSTSAFEPGAAPAFNNLNPSQPTFLSPLTGTKLADPFAASSDQLDQAFDSFEQELNQTNPSDWNSGTATSSLGSGPPVSSVPSHESSTTNSLTDLMDGLQRDIEFYENSPDWINY